MLYHQFILYISNKSNFIVSGGWDKGVHIYSVSDLKPLFKLAPAHTLPITCVRWINKDLVTCSADKTAALWDTSNGQQISLFTGNALFYYVASLVFIILVAGTIVKSNTSPCDQSDA